MDISLKYILVPLRNKMCLAKRIVLITTLLCIVFVNTDCYGDDQGKSKAVAEVNSVFNKYGLVMNLRSCNSFSIVFLNNGRFRNFVAEFSLNPEQYAALEALNVSTVNEIRRKFKLTNDDDFLQVINSFQMFKFKATKTDITEKVFSALVTALRERNQLVINLPSDAKIVSLPQSTGGINRVFIIYNERTMFFVATLWEQKFPYSGRN